MSRKAAKEPGLLTLTEASRVSGQPKAYLRELIEAGRLPVYVRLIDGEVRYRLTMEFLLDAALIAALEPLPNSDPSSMETEQTEPVESIVGMSPADPGRRSPRGRRRLNGKWPLPVQHRRFPSLPGHMD